MQQQQQQGQRGGRLGSAHRRTQQREVPVVQRPPPQKQPEASSSSSLTSRLLAAGAAAAISLSALLGSGGAASAGGVGLHQQPPPQPIAVASASAAQQQYQQQLQRLHPQPVSEQHQPPGRRAPASHLPSSGEAAALQLLHRDMFTSEAWAGMQQLQNYALYVEQTASRVEAGPACEDCAANRGMLERAWQTVANEFFDPQGQYSQARWAARLLEVLKEHHGALHTQAETYQALHQLVSSLGDPYTTFLDASGYRRALRRPLPAERAYLAAQFVGVGIQFGGLAPPDLGGRMVEGPLAGSPAEAAGIRHGDRVLEIDGLPAESLSLDETVTLLRGPVGSTISLKVAPASRGPMVPRLLELERRRLPQPALREARVPMPDGRFVQYVRVNYFCHETTSGLNSVVATAEADGRVGGYILDLRNDPGGVFEEAVAIAALFEDPTRAVANTVRSGSSVVDVVWRPSGLPPTAWPDVMAGPLTSKPLVLLVNSNTASASEVLAGALRDNERAVLMGEQTFGKGVVQYFYPLGADGSGLKVTVAKYLTPSMYDISKEGGLTPDIACRDYPHGVLTPGTADDCVLRAMNHIMSVPAQADPLSFSPLLADAGDGTAGKQ